MGTEFRIAKIIGATIIIIVTIIIVGAISINTFKKGISSDYREWATKEDLASIYTVYSFGQSPYNKAPSFLSLEERTLFSEGSDVFSSNLRQISPNQIEEINSNAFSCESCHFRDGRGLVHGVILEDSGFSVSDQGDNNTLNVFRQPTKTDKTAKLLTEVQWILEKTISLPGDETVELVRPVPLIDGTKYDLGLRNAPAVYGLGLIEAISDESIATYASEYRYKSAGVLGIVPNAEDNVGQNRIGRFGWKGQFANLSIQVDHALQNELGFVVHQNRNDLRPTKLNLRITNYLQQLSVPARRIEESESWSVFKGAMLFEKTGCKMCHKPSWKTGDAEVIPTQLRSRLIYPFTDFLLHDMGIGLSDLSKNDLNTHWQTPPLWGIGAQNHLSKNAGYLHDGRARTLTEAILWHGGEASATTNQFIDLSEQDRVHLIAFLESL